MLFGVDPLNERRVKWRGGDARGEEDGDGTEEMTRRKGGERNYGNNCVCG